MLLFRLRQWLWPSLVAGFFITFIPVLAICLIRLDPDFGWHLQAGNYFRAHGVPSHDVFTYTAANFPWIDHEWASDIILSYIYQIGGYGLAAVLSALLWAGGILLAAGRRAQPLVVLLAIAGLSPYVAVRPTAVTVLFFAASLAVLRRPYTRLYWFFPPLLVVWANLHGGFVAGLGLLVYYTVWRRSKRLAVVTGLSVVATLCNIYGIRIYEEIVRTLFDPSLHQYVQEWQRFSLRPEVWTFVVIWLAGFLIYQKPRWRRFAMLAPLLLLAALSASRYAVLFVLASVGPLSDYARLAVADIIRRLPRPGRLAKAFMLVCAGLLVSAGIGAVVLNFHTTNRTAGYPVEAVAYLRQHPCPGNIFNNYAYGGYLIWQLPQSKVYIDGRMPSWRPYMDRYVWLRRNPARYYPGEFERYNVACAVLDSARDKTLIKLLQTAGWRTVSRTPDATLLLKM